MFCKKCGKEIEESVKFCKHCGTQISINQNDDNKNDENIVSHYVWGYKFTETDLNHLSVLRHYIEAKGDYYLADEKLQEKKIYFYKSTKVSRPPLIIIYKQGDEVMIFGNEPGYVSVRSRFLNKSFKKVKKEQINFEDISSKDVKELITQNEFVPGKESAGPVGVGGWLIIPLINFFIIFPIFSLIFLFTSLDLFDYIFSFIDIAIAVYAIYAGYLLVKIKPYAVRHSIIVLILSSVSYIVWVISLYSLYDITAEYESMMMSDFWRVILFSIIWILYFKKSKRVKNTYIS